MMFQKYFIVYLATMLCFIACKQKDKAETPFPREQSARQIQRFGMVTGLNPEKVKYYKQLHASVWPAVQKKITECNIQNYSIFLKEVNGQLLLFSYFEYSGNDFNKDMEKIAGDSATQRWWRETDPCQQPLPDAASKKQIWSNMEEVFYQH